MGQGISPAFFDWGTSWWQYSKLEWGHRVWNESPWWWNEDIAHLVKLAQVTGLDEPGNVGWKMRPPKMIYYVGSCHKVAMMPSCIVSSSEDCWSFVQFNDDLMIPLWISPPKAAILQEEVWGVPDECSIHFLSEVSGSVHGSEPITDVSQALTCFMRFFRLGEGVIGQWSSSGRISEGTIIIDGFRCKSYT